MADCNELVQLIKQAAVDAVGANNPSGFYFGTVVSASPIKIKIDAKLVLGAAQLVLTRSVTTYTVPVDVTWETETKEGHIHNVTGKKEMTIHNELAAGDSVILARVQGGQKYIVIDKVG